MIPFHFPILTKLEFAEVRIASNNSTLFCIISIPTADIGSCSKLLVKPIKNGNFTNKLHYQNILNCNKIIYGNDKLCKSYNSLTICNENNLYDISNDTCIANLLRSQLSNCTLIDNRLVSAVEEITPECYYKLSSMVPYMLTKSHIHWVVHMLYSSTMSQSKYTKELTDLLRLLYYNHYHDTEFEEILTLEAVC